jgi:hypothetical protein
MTGLTAWSKVVIDKQILFLRAFCAEKKRKKYVESTTKGRCAIKVRAGHGSRLRSLLCARQIMLGVHTTMRIRPTTLCPTHLFGQQWPRHPQESNLCRIYRHWIVDFGTRLLAVANCPSVPFLRGELSCRLFSAPSASCACLWQG